MVTFTHLAPGTAEQEWRAEPRFAALPELDPELDHLVVVAAHPDDETLGAGGLLHEVHRRGARVTVVVATDGEASHPHSPTHSPAELRTLRRDEVSRALGMLAPEATLCFLSLPDGSLREHEATLTAHLVRVLDDLPDSERVVVVAPWSGDGHRDHRIAAGCVARVVAGRRVRHYGYPVWLWHWGSPDDMPWNRCHGLGLTRHAHAAKAHAMRTHSSQLEQLSDADGDEAIISSVMLEHFSRATELFIEEERVAADNASLTRQWFDDFYARHEDPWGFDTRWYEERKRAITMSCLPARSLGEVFEIGCATGLLTEQLASRARSVLAIDATQTAVDRTIARVHADGAVTVRQAMVPEWWPEGTFNTIVLSEVGYYLSLDELRETIGRIEYSLAWDGYVLAGHWRHPVEDYPLTGDQVHRELRNVMSWSRIALHEEEDFVLEVFTRSPAVSVAQMEGLR
ncbi:bifunctional PIG-L family deacetylase/class I SAM-dependent methyltransferase [Microbacterium sp. NPDC076911]|uniref:bifunctional PIG-L family deacetylase/class I SAM-dependent methyltransferase n=1 Tax=Microbacterium sp. NPDC076911 TaxID=3154958 RepID=UPI00342CB4BB